MRFNLHCMMPLVLCLSACSEDMNQKALTPKALLLLFSLMALMFIGLWVRSLLRMRRENLAWNWPRPIELAVGAVTDFFDTLGIGAFAPSTAIFRLAKIVPDELIPGTLNVGHTLPTIAQALIFIQIVDVAPSTLLPMISAAGIGAWLGTKLVGDLPRFQIRLGMGFAMLLAASIMLLSLLGVLPAGKDALMLAGWQWWVGVIGNFVLGLLMPLGIGLYAPCMILVSLLGMSPLAAFPIMMGSCAFLMPISSAGFFQNRRYQVSSALGLAMAGVPAVLLAAFLVKSLELDTLRWGVVGIVTYVALSILYSAWRDRRRTANS
ncbi:sulfite exporter TauE/SafE family protein [Undibacterium cyanobacteriorum]|uniref:Sulfite exporter TauE/SafE family protein n=1 Tax=Undibacterium cyanobacteriorum TaxID=3073561 RepID=A0ABY9RLP8_9BURK|nr:sulfite exporter TauE/SafE family protein [Undibacterium sp. 20NA77.5]WMW82143.1 sulfite exporter TauE/SafE family protein [Undibacterium sp. 20NA77.5]